MISVTVRSFVTAEDLPDTHLAKLDLFIAASFVYYDLWVVGGTHDHPEYLDWDME